MIALLRRFWTYYQPYRSLFFLDFSCAIVAAVLELSFPIFVSRVVDKLLPSGNWSLTLLACSGLLLVYCLNAILGFVVNYWGHMLGINIETEMRRSMFHHIQKLSFSFFDNHKTGHLMSRLSTDLMDIGELAHHGPEDVVVAIMTLVGAFALMLWTNAPLAWMTFALVPLMIWIGLKFQGRMTRAFRQMFSDIGDFNARVENNIGGIRVVQAFANEGYEKKLFAENNARFRLTKLLAYRIMSWSSGVSYLMTRLVMLFVMIAGAYFVFQGRLTNGQFIFFLLISGILFRPIDKINAVMELYPKGLAGFKRYLEIMDTAPDIADAPDAVEVGRLLGEIEFRGVGFAYDNGQTVLSDIDLTIRAGETIAFVGPSGAGKTTLCSLLPRFYDVTAGQITVDGLDIRDIQLHSLRSQIGIVQQDVFLFVGTLRENIAYGDLEADETQIMEAARRAHLKDFIDAQPEGLETLIGERGVKLSGGQKQRLAIARMFLKNPPILILDEATSALDTETEQIIQASLAELSQGRTTLVIAHRLATIKNADRIVVVTEQGIAEQGEHAELVGAGGVYSRLHSAQFSR